ncbi:hypothetical protein [Lysinibacter cavernae]|uniref:hypothetical protein n=1 Tax=Lysinibacter cavernae TaxID=1640652 RepID=UPI0036D8BD0E
MTRRLTAQSQGVPQAAHASSVAKPVKFVAYFGTTARPKQEPVRLGFVTLFSATHEMLRSENQIIKREYLRERDPGAGCRNERQRRAPFGVWWGGC